MLIRSKDSTRHRISWYWVGRGGGRKGGREGGRRKGGRRKEGSNKWEGEKHKQRMVEGKRRNRGGEGEEGGREKGEKTLRRREKKREGE